MKGKPMLEVLRPGLQSTFQDLGRWGWQHLGVPVCGAMDTLSHRIANLLVGNGEDAATLEVTLAGPSLRAECDLVVALAGAQLCASIHPPRPRSGRPPEPEPVPLHEPVRLQAGSVLAFGSRLQGARCYLAVAGGFELPRVMGSASTDLRSGFGGLDGRALQRGDRIMLAPGAVEGRAAEAAWAAWCGETVRDAAADALRELALEFEPGDIRLTPGRERRWFSDEATARLCRSPWRVDPHSNRMGCRLQGPALARRDAREMLSEGVSPGAMQVPNDGQPIVLMADRQATGGYPRIAQVASADLPRLAQMSPGETLRFEMIDLPLAQALRQRQEQRLEALRAALRGARMQVAA